MIAWWLAALAFAGETRVSASITVAVSQRDEVAEAVVEKTRELGGWFQSRTPTDLSLRVPVDQVDALIGFAAGQGKVVDRSLSRDDVSQALADARGRLEAREAVLDQYYAVLAQAGPDTVVMVEHQIVQAIAEIESLKGRIRVLEDQAAHARVDVSFRFRDRAAPARDGSSSFRWLNTLNVQDVIWALQSHDPDWRTRAAVPEAPEGFSAWKKRGRYRAASPDGVLFRVRTLKHKPRAELPFWKDAVRERMVAAGYRLVAEQELELGGAKGALIELAAPVGTEDWTYLVAFAPVGGKLVVAEAAGEVAALEARREALLAAIRGVTP